MKTNLFIKFEEDTNKTLSKCTTRYKRHHNPPTFILSVRRAHFPQGRGLFIPLYRNKLLHEQLEKYFDRKELGGTQWITG